MSKINVDKIVSDMQKLYQKDKKVKQLICVGSDIKDVYASKDMLSLPQGHPLRQLLGLPGIPFNKIIQVAGKPDCGKSTWATELMVSAQEQGAQVILWDTEDKFDSARLKTLGGKAEDILLIKTNEILKGAELGRRFITAIKDQDENAKILFVWDSVGGSQSRTHSEKILDDEKHAQPGQDAKENGQVMKMVISLINKYPDTIAVYLANQTYAKIGFMQKGDAAAGGAKITYHSSFIVMLKSIKTLTKTVKGVLTKYGIISRATVTKNHLVQGETSIHQLDFQITALGSMVSDEQVAEDDGE